jgi:hypothetical protein
VFFVVEEEKDWMKTRVAQPRKAVVREKTQQKAFSCLNIK